jgi:hypothetical protein
LIVAFGLVCDYGWVDFYFFDECGNGSSAFVTFGKVVLSLAHLSFHFYFLFFHIPAQLLQPTMARLHEVNMTTMTTTLIVLKMVTTTCCCQLFSRF